MFLGLYLLFKRVLSVFFLLIFSIMVFSASPTVASDSHPDGEWSNAPFIKVTVSYDGATDFVYRIDQSEDTIPDLAGEISTLIDATDSLINLGTKLDGVYWFHVRAKNSSGWSDTKHHEIKIDNNGPQRPPNVMATSSNDGTINVTWGAAEDDLAGIKHYNVYRSNLRFVNDGVISREFTIRDAVAKKVGEEITETTFHDTEVTEGYRYHYKIQPVDNANNGGTPSSVASVRAPSFCDFEISIDVTLVDENINITIDAGSNFKKGNVIVTNPEGVITEIVESESNVSSIETSYSLADQINGDFNVFFTSIDGDFDECIAEKIYYYDNVFPEIEILSPSTTNTLTEQVTFRIKSSDSGVNPSGIEKVSIYIEKDGEEVFVSDVEQSGENYVYDWNTVNYDNGRFKVIAKVFDKAGNQAEDSGVYSFENTFFAREDARTAITSAAIVRESALAYLSGLRKQNINADDLEQLLLNADLNFNYAEQLFDQGYYYELSQHQAELAEEIYLSVTSSISVDDYGKRIYIYNTEQLDIFLNAAGFDSAILNNSKDLIQKLQPSRRLEILKITKSTTSYYQANIAISFSNSDDNNLSLRVLEVIPKQFTDDSSNLKSFSVFEVMQSDPIVAFEPVLISQGKSVAIIYSLKQELTKEQADILLTSNVMNYYISPPILVDSSVDLSSVKLSSLLNLNSLISSLPPIEWNTTTLIIIGVAIAVVLLILLLILLFGVFSAYYFFIRKKH